MQHHGQRSCLGWAQNFGPPLCPPLSLLSPLPLPPPLPAMVKPSSAHAHMGARMHKHTRKHTHKRKHPVGAGVPATQHMLVTILLLSARHITEIHRICNTRTPHVPSLVPAVPVVLGWARNSGPPFGPLPLPPLPLPPPRTARQGPRHACMHASKHPSTYTHMQSSHAFTSVDAHLLLQHYWWLQGQWLHQWRACEHYMSADHCMRVSICARVLVCRQTNHDFAHVRVSVHACASAGRQACQKKCL